MEISAAIIKEADVLEASVLMGAVLLAVYDQLRIFRRLVPHGLVWIGIEDMLFWLVGAAAIFLMLYQENSGYIRGFAIGGVMVGMAVYNLLLSRHIVRMSVIILRKLLSIFGKPFAWTARLVGRPVKKVLRFAGNQLKKYGKQLE